MGGSRTGHGCSPVRGEKIEKEKVQGKSSGGGGRRKKKALEQNLARNSSRESVEGHLIL